MNIAIKTIDYLTAKLDKVQRAIHRNHGLVPQEEMRLLKAAERKAKEELRVFAYRAKAVSLNGCPIRH